MSERFGFPRPERSVSVLRSGNTHVFICTFMFSFMFARFGTNPELTQVPAGSGWNHEISSRVVMSLLGTQHLSYQLSFESSIANLRAPMEEMPLADGAMERSAKPPRATYDLDDTRELAVDRYIGAIRRRLAGRTSSSRRHSTAQLALAYGQAI